MKFIYMMNVKPKKTQNMNMIHLNYGMVLMDRMDKTDMTARLVEMVLMVRVL